MRDFGSWFNEQGQDEPVKQGDPVHEGYIWLQCCGCGKSEAMGIAAYCNGDTGWYCDYVVEEGGAYLGLCGGGPRCMP